MPRPFEKYINERNRQLQPREGNDVVGTVTTVEAINGVSTGNLTVYVEGQNITIRYGALQDIRVGDRPILRRQNPSATNPQYRIVDWDFQGKYLTAGVNPNPNLVAPQGITITTGSNAPSPGGYTGWVDLAIPVIVPGQYDFVGQIPPADSLHIHLKPSTDLQWGMQSRDVPSSMPMGMLTVAISPGGSVSVGITKMAQTGVLVGTLASNGTSATMTKTIPSDTWEPSAVMWIESEALFCTTLVDNGSSVTVSGLTHGLYGTTPASHSGGALVRAIRRASTVWPYRGSVLIEGERIAYQYLTDEGTTVTLHGAVVANSHATGMGVIATTIYHRLDGLTAGQSYDVQVAAAINNWEGPLSAVQSATIVLDLIHPTTPASLSVSLQHRAIQLDTPGVADADVGTGGKLRYYRMATDTHGTLTASLSTTATSCDITKLTTDTWPASSDVLLGNGEWITYASRTDSGGVVHLIGVTRNAYNSVAAGGATGIPHASGDGVFVSGLATSLDSGATTVLWPPTTGSGSWFGVLAIDSAGNRSTIAFAHYTTAPNPPTGLTVFSQQGQAQPRWTLSTSPGVDRYLVYAADAPNPWAFLPFDPVGSVDTNTDSYNYVAAQGTTKYFNVQAVDLLGSTSWAIPETTYPTDAWLPGTVLTINQSNFVRNGIFDRGGSNWLRTNGAVGSGYLPLTFYGTPYGRSIDTGPADLPGCGFAILVSHRSSASDVVYQDVSTYDYQQLQPGNVINFSLYATCNNNIGAGKAAAQLAFLDDSDATISTISIPLPALTSFAWQRLSTTATIPANTSTIRTQFVELSNSLGVSDNIYGSGILLAPGAALNAYTSFKEDVFLEQQSKNQLLNSMLISDTKHWILTDVTRTTAIPAGLTADVPAVFVANPATTGFATQTLSRTYGANFVKRQYQTLGVWSYMPSAAAASYTDLFQTISLQDASGNTYGNTAHPIGKYDQWVKLVFTARLPANTASLTAVLSPFNGGKIGAAKLELGSTATEHSEPPIGTETDSIATGNIQMLGTLLHQDKSSAPYVINPKMPPYNAIADSTPTSHPLSERYGTDLAAAQAVYPCATSLTDEIDWCACTMAFLDSIKDSSGDSPTWAQFTAATTTGIRNQSYFGKHRYYMPNGTYMFNKPLLFGGMNFWHMSGEGKNTVLYGTGTNMLAVLEINAFSHSTAGYFSVSGTPGNTAKYGVYYHWTPFDGNHQQALTIGGVPTGGSLTLAYNLANVYPATPLTTASIAYNASPATVQSALEALVGVGNVVCSGTNLPSGTITITFQGTLANTWIPDLIPMSSLTGGTSPAAAITTVLSGRSKVVRSATGNRFDHITIRNSMTTTIGLGVGCEDTVQVDNTVYYDLEATGGYPPGTGYTGAANQVGISVGYGAGGNVLNHNFVHCLSFNWKTGAQSSAGNVSFVGCVFQNNGYDFGKWGGTDPLVVENGRCEGSERIFWTGGSAFAAYPAQVYFKGLTWRGNNAAGDGQLAAMWLGGHLVFDSCHISAFPANYPAVPYIYANAAGSLTVTLRNCSWPASRAKVVQTDAPSRTFVQIKESYTHLDISTDTQITHTGDWSSLPARAASLSLANQSQGLVYTNKQIEFIAPVVLGDGYTSAPTVTVSGGGGTGAAATAVLSSTGIAAFQVVTPGTGYTNPTVSFTGGGSGAQYGAAYAFTDGSGHLSSVTVRTPGIFFAVPGVVINDPTGTGAVVTATLRPTFVRYITVTSGGTGYTGTPTAALSGGGVALATATPTVSSGHVASTAVANAGQGYTSTPTVTITGDGTGATAHAVLTPAGVNFVTMTTFGFGYDHFLPPTVVFTSVDGNGSGAAGIVEMSGSAITGVGITNPGSGYTAPPLVSFVDQIGASTIGSGAVGTVSLLPTTVASIAMDTLGTGYTTATVTISGGGVTLATASSTTVGALATPANLTWLETTNRLGINMVSPTGTMTANNGTADVSNLDLYARTTGNGGQTSSPIRYFAPSGLNIWSLDVNGNIVSRGGLNFVDPGTTQISQPFANKAVILSSEYVSNTIGSQNAVGAFSDRLKGGSARYETSWAVNGGSAFGTLSGSIDGIFTSVPRLVATCTPGSSGSNVTITIDTQPYTGYDSGGTATASGFTQVPGIMVLQFFPARVPSNITVQYLYYNGSINTTLTVATITGNTQSPVVISVPASANYQKQILITLSDSSTTKLISPVAFEYFALSPNDEQETQWIPRYSPNAQNVAWPELRLKVHEGTGATSWVTRMDLKPTVANSGSNVAYMYDTTNPLTGATKIVAFLNQGTERFGFGAAGHFKISSTAPTLANGAGAGTSPGAAAGTGSDSDGTITITTGTSCPTSGVLCTLTFSSAFASAPNVTLTANNAAAGSLNNIYVTTTTTTMVVNLNGTAAANSTAHTWFYHVLEA